MNTTLQPVARSLCTVTAALLIAAQAPTARAGVETRVGDAGARLAVVTPFETLRCVVGVEVVSFACTRGPTLAFELTWVRSGIETVWLQQVSEVRIGPLVVRTSGPFERRAAPVTGHFGGLPTDGPMGALIDTKGGTLEREVSMRRMR